MAVDNRSARCLILFSSPTIHDILNIFFFSSFFEGFHVFFPFSYVDAYHVESPALVKCLILFSNFYFCSNLSIYF